MTGSARERRTFVLDSARLGLDGVVVSLVQSGFLLVAIRYFAVSDAWKSLLAAAPHIGQLAALFLPALVARLEPRPNIVVAAATAVGALLLLPAAFAAGGGLFVLLVAGCLLLFNGRLPFLTAIHEQNYHPSRRGRRFAFGALLTVVAALLFDLIFGALVEQDLALFRPMVVAAAGLLLVQAVLLVFVPSKPTSRADRNPFAGLKLVREDKVFGRMLLAWFILGFANLFTLPLRVVYLAEADRGLGLSPFMVVLIAGLIPQATRLVFNRVWARVCDRLNLVVFRILLAVSIGTGIFLYFLTSSIPIIIIGNILISVSMAGGPIIWHTWVTRIAPPGQSHVYMSVHVFLTGVRGTIGPLVGFGALAAVSFPAIGAFALGLVVVAVVIVLPLKGNRRMEAPG